ncbi:4'-phosphopantetheinyl transferase family protein [Agrococcus baldri]|uniref:4'-phosphopantetheinyl transferase family protein n=1 Tax=Agrococcus baldri TaxID=153730 RepID=UPI0016498EA0|nr:4'-phosphopantetheinyl transferase superfamily protein [Agrococcus baldri]
MIDLLITTVDELLDRADQASGHARGARALVSEADLAAAAHRRRPVDARRTLAGRLGLRLLAAAATGAPLRELPSLPIDRSCDRCGEQHGRPRSAGVSLSSSTSGDLVLAVVGPADASVGVDVEVVPDDLWRGFDEYALHPSERDGRPGAPASIDERLAAWTEKEAVLKAAGLGLSLSPARLLLGGVGEARRWAIPRQGARWRRLGESGHPRAAGLHSTPVEARAGARAAVAATGALPLRRRSVDALLHAVDFDPVAGAACHPSPARSIP